ncbi:MAG: class I SAM-dependent methyltransferase [Chthoniobacterales bacterium]|nr:class I SAM-dependent methyltransferase [Chthoniobacterales bacterium]
MIPAKKFKSALRLLAKGQLSEFGKRAEPFLQSMQAAPGFYRRVMARTGAPAAVSLATDHPVAFESLDTAIPFGTAQDNSTNRAFVVKVGDWITRRTGCARGAMLDLGCSGGQLVADFRAIGWDAVGLEGSDFSLKHRRANWSTLANVALFTCDITRPFRVSLDGSPAKFDLITAWEVLEHIPEAALPQLFANITGHLKPGGLFIASTSDHPDIHNGFDLHVTKMSNAQWHQWIAMNAPVLVPVDLPLKRTEYVRCVSDSFLTMQRREDSEA